MNFKESEIKFESQVFFENIKNEILSKTKTCPTDFIQKPYVSEKRLRNYNINFLNFLKDISSIL